MIVKDVIQLEDEEQGEIEDEEDGGLIECGCPSMVKEVEHPDAELDEET